MLRASLTITPELESDRYVDGVGVHTRRQRLDLVARDRAVDRQCNVRAADCQHVRIEEVRYFEITVVIAAAELLGARCPTWFLT